MLIVGSLFLAVGIVLGTVFVLLGSRDYSAYTGRAQATVGSVDTQTSKSSSGQTRTSRSYDVGLAVGAVRSRRARHPGPGIAAAKMVVLLLS